MLSPITVPYSVLEFTSHQTLKDEILREIDIFPAEEISSFNDSIYKTDWTVPRDVERRYFDLLKPSLFNELLATFNQFGFNKFEVHNFWFQQYLKSNSHSWHTHAGCHYTCIYYLELPLTAPPTQFLNPVDQTTVFQFDVKEGDILIIPSMFKHRAPLLATDVRKTIISFNVSLICDNE